MIKYSDWEFYLVNQSYPNGNGSIYLWGGQGENRAKLTDEYIKKKETSTANAKRVIALRDKRIKEGYKNLKAYDCSGLGVAYFIEKGELKSDTTAHGLYTKSTKKTRSELKAGDCVFRMYTSGSNKGHVYHVGYVISENKIVHAKGRDEGVVIETLNQNGADWWNAYGHLPFIETKQDGYEGYVFTQTLYRKKCKGKVWEDVKALQWLLNKDGFNCGSIDGLFGKNTEKAVKACQKAYKLTRDGIAGKNTIKALGGIWK